MNKIYKRIASVFCACACLMCSVSAFFNSGKNTTVASAQGYDETFSSYSFALPVFNGLSFLETDSSDDVFLVDGIFVSISPTQLNVFSSADGLTPSNVGVDVLPLSYNVPGSLRVGWYSRFTSVDAFDYPCSFMSYETSWNSDWSVKTHYIDNMVSHCFIEATQYAGVYDVVFDTYIRAKSFSGGADFTIACLSVRFRVSSSYVRTNFVYNSLYDGAKTYYNIYYTDDIVGWSYASTPTLLGNYNKGYAEGQKYGETIGYNKGYAEGVDDANNYTFKSLISSVVDVPINAFRSLFNFDLLGFNMANFMMSLLTLGGVLAIIRLIL